ncbi:hypothetical protein [Persephonella sp. KM09-Lau-8]|uniref:hypothetical protein n=1 Tax=Persephonella sp. KM09-Lau-8 TaxID=1158345 RepID=UPI0012DC2B67|nr:hypothetical protein [Persephonella sp. KM09-Lau-8]
MRKAKDAHDALSIVKQYVELPDFKSVIDELEFLAGFSVGLVYFTKSDIEKEMLPYVKALNLEGLKLTEYYVFFSEYFDKRYDKMRYKIDLIPKPGSFASKTSRIPKVKDPYEAKEMVSILREYLSLFEVINQRRFEFFKKVS